MQVQCRDTRKALAPLRVNGSNSTVAASTEIKKKSLSRNLAREGKENAAQKKCNAAKVENVVQKKGNATKTENPTQKKCDAGGDRKVVKKSVSGSVVAGTVCSKVKNIGHLFHGFYLHVKFLNDPHFLWNLFSREKAGAEQFWKSRRV